MVLALVPLVTNYNQFLQTDISHVELLVFVVGFTLKKNIVIYFYYLHNAKNSLGAKCFRLLFFVLVDWFCSVYLPSRA